MVLQTRIAVLQVGGEVATEVGPVAPLVVMVTQLSLAVADRGSFDLGQLMVSSLVDRLRIDHFLLLEVWVTSIMVMILKRPSGSSSSYVLQEMQQGGGATSIWVVCAAMGSGGGQSVLGALKRPSGSAGCPVAQSFEEYSWADKLPSGSSAAAGCSKAEMHIATRNVHF